MKPSLAALTVLPLRAMGGLRAEGPASAQSAWAPPPGLEVGEVQLAFREGVDPKKLNDLVAETWKRSQGFAEFASHSVVVAYASVSPAFSTLYVASTA